jgi:hypothetical protein
MASFVLLLRMALNIVNEIHQHLPRFVDCQYFTEGQGTKIATTLTAILFKHPPRHNML